jgi:hypothetical protein
MRGIEFEALVQQLGEHRRRRHRQCATEGHSRLPAQSHGTKNGGDDCQGHQHLQQTEAENDALHRVQLGQRELEADREHQEDDAELGQMLHAGKALDQIEGVRADQRADQQVTEYRRQADRTKDDHRNHRSAQQQQNGW